MADEEHKAHGHNPEREARRLAMAQAAAEQEAERGRKHPGAPMVAVFSVAGFELADIFAEWARRWDTKDQVEGLGAPCPMSSETPEQFGDRIARGILRLLKEV